MKNIYQIIILMILPISLLGQDIRETRKGKFIFSVGPEYRITPYYNFVPVSVNNSISDGFTNIDKQNSGMAINIDVEYFITKNFALGFTNSFRYDLVVGEYTIGSPTQVEIKKAQNGLLLDYNLYLAYYFKIFKKGEFFVNAGFSMMNRNSEFSVKETRLVEGTNDEFTIYTISDYNYFANKISLGYKNGIGKIYLGIYTTQTSPYFNETTRFNIPFIGCSFDIGKL